jgi:hypothetical protein
VGFYPERCAIVNRHGAARESRSRDAQRCRRPAFSSVRPPGVAMRSHSCSVAGAVMSGAPRMEPSLFTSVRLANGDRHVSRPESPPATS